MSDQARVGWLVTVRGPNELRSQSYAVGGASEAYHSLEEEIAYASARVGDHLSVTNELVEFVRRLTNGEITRVGLKAGEVKRFD
jgi:hypothetical protein